MNWTGVSNREQWGGDIERLQRCSNSEILQDIIPTWPAVLRADSAGIWETLDPVFQVTYLFFQYDDLHKDRKRHLPKGRQLVRARA